MIQLNSVLSKMNKLFTTLDSGIPIWLIQLLIAMLNTIVHILENHQKTY